MFGLIENGQIVDRRAIPLEVGDWRPLVVEGRQSFDPATQSETVSIHIEETRIVQRFALVPRPVLASDIKLEAQRRIMMLMGATSLEHCMIKQLNANMRANELNAIHYERAWTPEEDAEANALKAMANAVKAVRARSNQIEAMDPIPLDFTADAHW